MASGDPIEQTERSRVSAAETSWALRDVNRAAADVDHALARRMGLRPLDYTALSHVMTAEGAMGPYRLSGALGISSGSATELIDRLERAGHVRRRRDEQDRRRVSVQATDAAVQRVLGELAPLFSAVDTLAEEFTEPERAAIARFLRQAAEILRAFGADEPGPPVSRSGSSSIGADQPQG